MGDQSQANNKRIAKNTLLLYFRMFLLMAISLYTSRIILNALGVEDYGIYNVVGGVVLMFNILSGSLSAAVSRFITFEIGTGNIEKLKKVFSTSVNVQLIMILIITVLLETIGLWFLNYKMVIPTDRIEAANWVFQFSIITFAINLWSIPYNAAIIAHERMSAFAYFSIFEAVAKLIIAFVIMKNPVDRLVYYGILLLVVGLIQRFFYTLYCKRHFEECKYRKLFDKELTKEMLCFAGWNFFGAGSWQLMTQGVNLLLNLFFGVTVNAARGIANQVDTAILQFVNNFTTALNPQITKSFASNDRDYMYSLMYRGAKFSYFLMLFFAIPIMCETTFLFQIWLGVVPDYAVSFARLTLMVSMVHVLSNTMVTAMLATGNIKKYQIIVGGLGMLVFPLAWLFFYIGLPPEAAYLSTVIIFVCQLVCRLRLMKEMIGMNPNDFIKEVLLKGALVTVCSAIVPLLLVYSLDAGVIRFLIVGTVSVIGSVISMYFIGMKESERAFLLAAIMNVKNKLTKG